MPRSEGVREGGEGWMASGMGEGGVLTLVQAARGHTHRKTKLPPVGGGDDSVPGAQRGRAQQRKGGIGGVVDGAAAVPMCHLGCSH